MVDKEEPSGNFIENIFSGLLSSRNPESKTGPLQMIAEILLVVAILYGVVHILSFIFSYVTQFFRVFFSPANTLLAGPYAFLIYFIPYAKVLLIILAAILFVGIVHFSRKLGLIHAEMGKGLYPVSVPTSEKDSFNEKRVENQKWKRVQEHINSDHPSDWKFAILEADIMLDELLDVLNYQGDTMSEKLKQVESSDFLTLDIAWEAHKVRNQIAHEGAEFLINEREAHRVIGLYEQVFTEFKCI